LREEKVKLQEERVKVQKDKELLRLQIEAIQVKQEDDTAVSSGPEAIQVKQEDDTAVSSGAESSKKELEDQVKANEELLKTQTAKIKELEEKIQKLLALAAGQGTKAEEASV
jgi:hypothetical protein